MAKMLGTKTVRFAKSINLIIAPKLIIDPRKPIVQYKTLNIITKRPFVTCKKEYSP